MAKSPTQSKRTMAIATSLAEDAVLLESFTYTEDFSRPYRLTAIVTSAKPGDIAVESTIGQLASIRVQRKDKKTRYFGGIVSRVAQDARVKERPRYELTIVPKFWLLSRNADCRIFQKKTVPQIIKEVFSDRGISDTLSDTLKGTYEKRDYTVQYRESDFNFLSRLMEMEGIYYFFTHDKNGKHQLVLADDTACHEPLDGYPELAFQLPGSGLLPDRVTDWRSETEISTEKVTLRAFDFKAPNIKPKESKTLDFPSKWEAEIFDYPVEFHLPAEVKRHAKLRAEEYAAAAMSYSGQADCRGVCCGGKFKLTDPVGQLRKNQTKDYLVIGVNIRGSAGEYQSGPSSGAGEEFSCAFRCIQANKIFRSPRTTPKPIVAGSQTAIVVGPSGSHIHTDKHGRIKLQFHWDRYGKSDENSSCWIRVSQAWAGQGWGGLAIPRVGQEVIVEFLEGDPDRPLVIGRVYNEQCKAPFKLPDKANISGMRSDTVGSNGGGYNEMSMDDSPGKEMLNVQAQYDMTTLVKHDQKLTVNNNRSATIDVDDTETVTGKQTISVTGDQSETYSAKQTITVGAARSLSVGAKQTIDVAADQAETIGGKSTLSVTGAYEVTAGPKISFGAAQIELNGTASIKLSAGGSTIELNASGITITGAMIKISGSGPVDIKGALVKINS